MTKLPRYTYPGVPGDDLAQAVDDFLYALDRGDFGNGHRFGDGTESAYVTSLREKLIEHLTDASLVAQARLRGHLIAADACAEPVP